MEFEIKDPHINRRIGRRKFIKSWAWPGEVEEFLKEKAKGFVIHVCSGSSKLGDVTIDEFMPAMIKADMYNLPIKTGIADTVICDPPWGIARHMRMKLVCELRRILKVEGILLFNAPWLPHVPQLKLLEIWVAVSIAPQNDCGVISVCQKVGESFLNDR